MQCCQNATRTATTNSHYARPMPVFADFRARLFCLHYVESATGHRVSALGPPRHATFPLPIHNLISDVMNSWVHELLLDDLLECLQWRL